MDRFQIGVHFVALAAAFALAVPIGWDREKRARSAGLRTFPLVAMASCGFVQASESLLVHSPDGMAKVIEGLITGIGFIGGGAILKQGTTVQGTATAASLWATGAIGVSVGLGSYDVAVTVAVFTFLTLRLLTLVKEEDDLKDDEKNESKSERKSDTKSRLRCIASPHRRVFRHRKHVASRSIFRYPGSNTENIARPDYGDAQTSYSKPNEARAICRRQHLRFV